MTQLVQMLWRYRQFIVSSIRAEFAARFARSRLAGAWMIIHPLLQSAVLAFVLSGLMAARLPVEMGPGGYVLYMLAGMLGWALFSELVTRSLTIFIDNANLLKKLAFPRLCLPMIAGGTALVNNTFLLLATLMVYATLGHFPSPLVLWLPVLMALVFALALSAGVILGVINVFVRDVGQIATALLQFMFWSVPVVYVPSLIPEKYRAVLEINPMYQIVKAYQDVLVFNTAPNVLSLLYVAVIAALLMVSAFAIFRRASPELVDVL